MFVYLPGHLSIYLTVYLFIHLSIVSVSLSFSLSVSLDQQICSLPCSDLAALPAMATMLLTGPPMLLFYSLYVLLQRCGYCVPQEPPRQPLEESVEGEQEKDEEKVHFERGKEIDAFLFKSDNNIFTDSVMKENESKYGLVLHGMTRIKLMADTKETNIL